MVMFNRSAAKSNPDPWQACHFGVTDHPRYLDCANCEHCFDGTPCDFGAARFRELALEAQKTECDRMVAEIDAFCKTAYY